MNSKTFTIVVLISGNGSNLQALIDAAPKHDYQIAAVISNVEDAYGLARAKAANIPTVVLPHTDFAHREDFDQALQNTLEQYNADLVVLAGFMRRLGTNIVHHFSGRMINIHPSLLPKYPGLNTHKKVIAAKDKEHGVSIHFVTDDLDAGPIISQAKLTVNPNDTPETLQQRVLQLEHKLYPQTVQLFAEGRVSLQHNKAQINNNYTP